MNRHRAYLAEPVAVPRAHAWGFRVLVALSALDIALRLGAWALGAAADHGYLP